MSHTIKIEIVLDKHDVALITAADDYPTDKNGDGDGIEAFNELKEYLYRLVAANHGLPLRILYGLNVREDNDLLCFRRDNRDSDVPF